MAKIIDQLDAGKHTVLLLDKSLPLSNFRKVLIEKTEYDPEIVYEMKNAIAIRANGNFINKEIIFI